jgi:hypothetical protein
MTRRESILAAIRTALTGTTGVGTRIYRSRVEPFARNEAPAIIVTPMMDTAALEVHSRIDWLMTVQVVVIVRGNVPDQLADPIIESAHSKLMADTTLGGLAIDITPGDVTWADFESDQPTGLVTLNYRVRYRTALTDLATN